MSQNKTATQEKPTGKYGAMIQKARSLESQNTSTHDSETDPEIENRTTSNPENQQAGNPENQNAGQEEKEEEVNLSIKVAKRLRRHWVAEAKRRDTSLTAIIIGHLKDTLGEP